MHKIKLWKHGFLNDDEHGYPHNSDRFYSTCDICNILHIPMATLQQWLKDDFIRPAYRVKYGRGMKSLFVRSQVFLIGAFMKLINYGISRKIAVNLVINFHNELKKKGEYSVYRSLVIKKYNNKIMSVDYIKEIKRLELDSAKDYIVIGLDNLIMDLS